MNKKDNILRLVDRVLYVPLHANGDTSHEDCESGTINSFSENGKTVFVKFDKQVRIQGWQNTTAKGCNIEDLVKI